MVAIPSLHEGFGLVAVEAMAAGTPVVASRVDGLAEIIEHEISGWHVEAGDANALADALRRLYREPLLGRGLVLGGEARAEGFAVGQMICRYEQAYRVRMASPRRTAASVGAHRSGE